MDSSEPPWRQSAALRAREFYSYYDPIRVLNEPSISDLNSPEPLKPRSSPDTALTAFCQLGALRLGTQRCMLMFFDTEYVYILAEATKTLSLQDDDVHNSEDSLWLGFTAAKRGLTVCEHTINVPPERMENGEESSHSVYIIKDLLEDPIFRDRPFVTGPPKARFYAGVPITTPNNVRIGSYCVLDDKPRDGLSPLDVDFLWQMSKTVMSHLEMLRTQAELGIGTNMLTGLGNLVRTSTAGLTGRESLQQRSLLEPEPPSPAKDGLPDTHLPSLIECESDGAIDASSKTYARHGSGDDMPTGADSRHVLRGANQVKEGSVQQVFQTAATLLKTAVAVDGALFLDASINTYGGSVRHGGSSSFDTGSETPSPSGGRNEDRETKDAPCKILGLSVSSGNDAVREEEMSEKFLKSLLEQYPRGKVWNLEESASSEYVLDASEKADLNSISDGQLRADRTRTKHSEARQLQRLFPGVRSLGLVGSWDAIRERWFCGTLIWTYSRSRVFSNDIELVFLIAFNDVLMAEVTRLEAQMESKAKSDFISSISHELRSPLQGILCGIDLLSEQKSADMPILSQIEMCSTTLLEVINHLLDFAKVNNLSGRVQSPMNQFRKTKDSDPLDDLPESNFGRLLETYSYAKITEEICDSMFYSHCYTKERVTNVDLILDISMDANVHSSTDVGAWKRICINIINNALKYTDEGYVAASLKAGSWKDGRQLVVFSVVDTGRGMSTELVNRWLKGSLEPRVCHVGSGSNALAFDPEPFLNNRLFRPFQQEDDLSQGTGLGMSLVSKLVDGLGGNVEVHSLKGCGTTLTISIPLDGRIQNKNGTAASKPCQGVRIGIVERSSFNKETRTVGRQLLRDTLEHSCLRIGAEMTSQDASDVQMVFEADIQGVEVHESGSPMIVLCDSFVSAHRLRKSLEIQWPRRHIECIAQPYGPIRLANAIQACINSKTQRSSINGGVGLANGTEDHMQAPQIAADANTALQSDHAAAAGAEWYATALRLDEPQDHFMEYPTSPGKTHSNTEPARQPSRTRSHDERPRGRQPSSRPLPSPRRVTTDSSDGKPSVEAKNADICLLLVDDNTVNLRMLVAYADRYGYNHLSATNGREAVEAYENATLLPVNGDRTEKSKSIVILLDINMPIMDGFEAARRIRAVEKTRSLQPATVIAVTGLGSAEALQKAHASGMDIFLTKPVRPRELTEVLASIFASPSDSTQPKQGAS